ncbi:MAG: hypothetical protein RLZ72_404, partial [Actinomycetota bacterium]
MSETRREARQRRSGKRSRGFIAGIVIASLVVLGGGGYVGW